MSLCLLSRTSRYVVARKTSDFAIARQAAASISHTFLHCHLGLPSLSSSCRSFVSPTLQQSCELSAKPGLTGTNILCSPFAPLAELRHVQTFKSQYLSSRRSGRYVSLSPEQFSSLISLFGSLSIPEECTSKAEPETSASDTSDRTFSPNPLARNLLVNAKVPAKVPPNMHWSFVVTIAQDKRKSGYQLSDGDNYWLMRAALQDARQLVERENRDENALRDHLDRARTYYFNIRSHHPWRTHHTFLDTLMTFSRDLQRPASARLNGEVVERLASILGWRIALHPMLLNLVWRAFLFPSDLISTKAKAKLVNVLRRKLEKESARLRRHLNNESSGPQHTTIVNPSVRSASPYSVGSVQELFIELLFSPLTATKNDQFEDARHWILWQTQFVLGPTDAGDDKRCLEVAWSNLRLLALSLQTVKSNNEGQDANASNRESGAATTPGWTVVCSLSAIERVVKDGGLQDDKEGVRGLVQSLWVLWRRETEHALSFSMMHAFTKPGPISEAYISGGSHLPRAEVPTSILCAVASSFLRLAAQVEDVRLHRAVLRHVERIIVEPTQLAGHTVSNDALQTVAVRACVGGAVLGNKFTLEAETHPSQWTWTSVFEPMYAERLLPDFRDREENVNWSNAVANRALLELTDYSIEGAYSLYTTARDVGVDLAESTILALGRAFNSVGNHDLSLVCIRDERLSSTSAQQLFDATMRDIVRSRGGFLDLHLIRSLIGVMVDTRPDGTMLKLSKRQYVEGLVNLCIRSRHVEEAAQVVQLLQRQTTNDNGHGSALLRPKFVQRLVRSLLSNRRYRLLAQMLTDSSETTGTSSSDKRSADALRTEMLKHPELRFVRRLISTTPGKTPDFSRARVNKRLLRQSIPFSRYDWPTLSRFVRFRPKLALEDKRVISLQLSSAIKSLRHRESGVDEQTLERIASILVRIGRSSAALKILDIYSKKTKEGKPSISTRAGNIILGASLLPKRNRRNLRQFEHAARRLQKLIQERGFVPDRITLNILMKSLLRWENLTPADTLRELFDKLVKSGFAKLSAPVGFFDSVSKPPSSEEEGAPRGLPSSAEDVLSIKTAVINQRDGTRTPHRLNIRLSPFAAHSKRASFDLHIRPLYKMFVKAFYARGDKDAARGVLESLRLLQAQAMKEGVRQSFAENGKMQRLQKHADRDGQEASGSS